MIFFVCAEKEGKLGKWSSSKKSKALIASTDGFPIKSRQDHSAATEGEEIEMNGVSPATTTTLLLYQCTLG